MCAICGFGGVERGPRRRLPTWAAKAAIPIAAVAAIGIWFSLSQGQADLNVGTTTGPTTTATTTTLATTSTGPDLSSLAVPFFLAIYEDNWDLAITLSTGAAADWAAYRRDRQEDMVDRVELWNSDDDIRAIDSESVRACDRDDALTPEFERCFTATGFVFDADGLLESFEIADLNGEDPRPVSDRLRGGWEKARVEASWPGTNGTTCTACVGFGFEESTGRTTTVMPRWVFSGPSRSEVILEFRTDRPFEVGWRSSGHNDDFDPMNAFLFGFDSDDVRPLISTRPSTAVAPTVEWGLQRGSSPLNVRISWSAGIPLDSVEILMSHSERVVFGIGIDAPAGSSSATIRFWPITVGDALQTRDEFMDSRLWACTSVPASDIIRNPIDFYGDCIETYLHVFQLDANTGSCAFLGEFSEVRSTRASSYTHLGWFGFGESPNLFDLKFQCPPIADLREGDLVHVYAVVRGTYTYTTTLGLRSSVPAFDVVYASRFG